MLDPLGLGGYVVVALGDVLLEALVEDGEALEEYVSYGSGKSRRKARCIVSGAGHTSLWHVNPTQY